MGYIKLPDDYAMRRHLNDGMGVNDIAKRYGCHPETVRKHIANAGLKGLIQSKEASQASKKFVAITARQSIEITDRKIIFMTEYSGGERGRSVRRGISVPYLSMHVDALREAGRC